MAEMNVVDAFVLKLGWDTRDFRRGGEEITDAGKRTRESLKRGADDIEARNKLVGESFGRVKNEVIGLGLAFAGATGLKDFVSQIVLGDAATGRLSRNINVATRELSAWQGVVGRVGGAPGDADAALSTLQKAYQDLTLTGTTALGPGLAGLGVTDPNDLKNPTSALLKFADAADRMTRPEFVARMQMLGMPDSVINSLALGRKHVEALLEDQRKLGVATERDAEAAAKMQSQLSRLASAVRGEARPEIEHLVGNLADFLTTADGMDAAKDTIIGVLAAVGLAAAAAVGPWIALAAAIGGIAYLFEHPGALGSIHKGTVRGPTAAEKAAGARLDQYAWYDPRHYFNVHRETAAPTADGSAAVPAHGGVAGYFERHGYSAEQARGIAAGIHAEGGGLGMAANGAFGIGQWRGARYRALVGRYGPNPTLAQQLEFLDWELKGGDRGGAAVRGATTADSALGAYVHDFMRPAAGAETAGDMRRGRAYLARGGAAAGATTNVTIHQITVNTRATDAKGIARDIGPALQGRAGVVQANSGLTP